jgi:hypothetical protein
MGGYLLRCSEKMGPFCCIAEKMPHLQKGNADAALQVRHSIVAAQGKYCAGVS